MSCSTCSNNRCSGNCYEARLSLGLSLDQGSIIGSLDGVHINPIPLKSAIKAHETNTTLKYDPRSRSLVLENERAKNGGSPDYVSSKQILTGATLSDISGVLPYVPRGLASIVEQNGEYFLGFNVPNPVGANETSRGFIVYVENPEDGVHYKRIIPDIGGDSDVILLGKPNGDIEFSNPITSPLLVPVANLTSDGKFSGTPAVSSGTWRYQQLGQSQVVENLSGSKVEVRLRFSYSLQTAGTRSGVYALLVNGGSDYKTTFVQGQNNIKQEGYPGGVGEWAVILEPNQKCQFQFGAWTNASGSMVATIGSVDESAGSTIQTVYQPTITIRRLV